MWISQHEKISDECQYIDIDCGDPTCELCTYKDISASICSCTCHNRLYEALCEAGITDSIEAIDEGTECSDKAE